MRTRWWSPRGEAGGPARSRLELLRENAAVVSDIARKAQGCRGTIVIVTNPVDVLTRVMTEVSGLPPLASSARAPCSTRRG